MMHLLPDCYKAMIFLPSVNDERLNAIMFAAGFCSFDNVCYLSFSPGPLQRNPHWGWEEWT